MPNVELYEDAHGRCPFHIFCSEVQSSGGGKNAKVQLTQIFRQIRLLEEVGTRGLTGGAVKHIRDGIWELRPGNNRVLFFFWQEDTYVILHAFRKTTQQIPPQQLEQAEREVKDWISRHGQK